jgi:hypothetical protein
VIQPRAGGHGQRLARAAGIEDDGEEAAPQQHEELQQQPNRAAQRDDHEQPDEDRREEGRAHGVGVVKTDRRGLLRQRRRGGRLGGGGEDLGLGIGLDFGLALLEKRPAAAMTKPGVGGRRSTAGTEINHEFSLS